MKQISSLLKSFRFVAQAPQMRFLFILLFIVQRKAPTTLTSNYAINFFIKADAQSNNVEFKFLDETGDNVWWHIRRGYEFSTTWTKLITRPRNIQFSWGPLGSGDLKAFDKFEIAISAVKGGKGAIYFDEFVLEEKSSDTTRHRVEVMMTEQIRGYSQDSARVGEDKVKINRVREGKGNRFVRLDLGASRELGGLVIEWDSVLFARDYRILLSDDARKWSEHYRVKDGNGGKDFIPLPDAETRYVRVQVTSPGNAAIGVRSLHIKPVEFSLTSNAFFTNVAQESPIGFYPRIWLGEQSYWTVFGVRGDMSEALISEEGRIELNKESPSIEPFLFLNGKLTTWSDVKLSQSLEDGFLPVPSVRWEKEGLAVIITAFADGAPDASSLNVRYRVVNSSKQMQRGKFYLAVRPFQVNPAWQELNTVGGVAKISSLEYRDSSVWINRRIRVGYPIVPAQVGVASFEGGDIVEYLAKGILPPSTKVQDKPGYSSCAVAYDVDLAPAESAEFYAVSAFHSTQAVRSTLAYTLVNRDGAGIQPGSRVYERSWIRDGVLTAGALLRLGHAQEVREFLEWYAKFQFPNGKIPCVVDRRGADPVPEHDSPGQFIHGVYEYYAFTQDERFLIWEAYTPYEHRIANALIRLGEPERAHELIRWILNDRRPKEWNEWAEVVWRGYRPPRFIGDMPHTWCGTEFILSVRSMFVYEREWDTTLVVGAGFRRKWLADQTGVAATNLPTYYGTINLRAIRQNNRVVYELGGSLRDNARVLLKSPILSSSQHQRANLNAGI